MFDDLTVLLARGSSIDEQVLGALTEWSQLGLLRPFVWLNTEDVDLSSEFPHFTCWEVSGGDKLEAELLSVLSRTMLRHIRVIVLETVSGGQDDAEQHLSRSRDLISRITPVLPVRVGTTATPLTRLDSCVLVVPDSEASTEPLRRGRVSWTRTIVVSPELRAAPDAIPEFVRDTDLASHTAAHGASVGALWRGMGQGVLDDLLSGTTSSGYQNVILTRSFARLVLAAGLGDELTDEVIAVANNEQAPPLGTDLGVVPSLKDEHLVQRAYSRVADFGDFDFRHPAAEPAPGKRATGSEVLGDVGRFFGSSLALLWTRATSAVRRGAEVGATRVTYGEQGTTEVRFSPRPPAQLRDDADTMLRPQVETNHELLRQAEDSRRPEPRPQLWQRLREVSFGLVDGHQRETSAGADAASRPEVVTDRAFVVAPPPPHTIPGPGTRALLADDLNEVDAPLATAQLHEVAPILGEAARLAEDRLTALDGSADTEKEADSEPNHAVSQLSASTRTRLNATTDREALQSVVDDAAALDAHAQAVDRSRRLPSLHARLSDRCQEALGTARAAADDLRSRANHVQLPRTEQVARARRIFLIGSYVAIVAWLGWIAWVAFTWWGERDVYSLMWFLTNALLVGGLVAFTVVLVLSLIYFQAQSRFQRQVDQTLHQLRVDGQLASAAVHEQARLADVDIQLRGWSQILAHSIHAPYRHLPHGDTASADPESFRKAQLPSSAQVLVRPHAQPSRRKQAEVVESEIHPAWLTDAFGNLAGHIAEELELPDGLLLAKADEDVPSAPNGLRDALLERLATGQPQSKASEALRDRIALLVTSYGDDGDQEHATAARHMRAITGPGTTFVQYPFTATGRVAQAFEPDRSTVWVPAGTSADPAIEVRTLGRSVAAGRTLDVCVRSDVSSELDPGQLEIFSSSPPRPPSHPPADTDRF